MGATGGGGAEAALGPQPYRHNGREVGRGSLVVIGSPAGEKQKGGGSHKLVRLMRTVQQTGAVDDRRKRRGRQRRAPAEDDGSSDGACLLFMFTC